MADGFFMAPAPRGERISRTERYQRYLEQEHKRANPTESPPPTPETPDAEES